MRMLIQYEVRNHLFARRCETGPCGSVVEHPLRDREVVGSNPGRAIPVATLLGAQHNKASTGFSSSNKYRTTNTATLTKIKKSEKSPIIINVCIHRWTVWKTGNYAKYVILFKYRDYYYYYYYYKHFLRGSRSDAAIALMTSFVQSFLGGGASSILQRKTKALLRQRG